MQDLNDLYYFVQVVDHGGYSAAGRALGIQKSKLSRRMLALEERLGVRLLLRSTRRFAVTEIGREFYERCVAMLVEADSAEQLIARARSEPRGVIRMSCPVALLSYQFGDVISRFMVKYPEVEVHLESTNRRVDVTAEGFDLAIRVRFPPLEPTELVMRKLDDSTQCLVAAPSLVAVPLTSPADLNALPTLDLGPANRTHQWSLQGANGETATISHRPKLVTDDMAVLRDAALRGVGVVQLPTILVWRDVEAGRLMHVIPEWRPISGIVHAVFPSRRGLLPSVRAFLDFAVHECVLQRHRADASFDRIEEADSPPPKPSRARRKS